MAANSFVFFIAVAIFGCAQICECQVFFGGECLDLESVKNFDVPKYMGAWYVYQKYPSDLEKTSKCNMDYYELKNTGDVSVLKSSFNTMSKSFVEMLGTVANVNSGRFHIQFKDLATAARSRFWVLDTDYTNYSVLYACTPITNHYHTRMVWIMTREKYPKADAVMKAFRTLAKNKLTTDYLTPVDQRGCSAKTSVIDKIMQFF